MSALRINVFRTYLINYFSAIIVAGPASMTQWCKSLLKAGKYRFCCPHANPDNTICGREWPYFLVRHVACFTDAENQEIEGKLTENGLQQASGSQPCPGCDIWCQRKDATNNRVTCHHCTKKKGATYDFCWACSREWKAGQKCGHDDCDGRNSRIRVLADCPMKKIYGVEVPSRRGCPECGMLIEHKEACKHMTCETCNQGFCFVCLQPRLGSDKWPCAWNKDCEVAPRQTSLPGV